MQIETQIDIAGSKEDVWRVVTDIDSWTETISAIEKIEVLERPATGLIGRKWRETRIMFGKTATEVMWITDVKENEFYQTRAESHGAVYISRISIADRESGVTLAMGFDSMPQTFAAKIMAATMGRMLKKAMLKALLEDLHDIKAVVEGGSSGELG